MGKLIHQEKSQKVDGNKEVMGVSPDGLSKEQSIKTKLMLINTALVRDFEGKIMVKVPTMLDPETKTMQFAEVAHKEVIVPPEQVVFTMMSPISERNTGMSETVQVGNDRQIVVFDRAYEHKGRIIYSCAWVPNLAVRAGLLYKKVIEKKSNRPIAVLKKIPGSKSPLFQIVGGKESDYRDLKRVFERVFIKKGGPVSEEDEQLNQFMHDATPAIAEEQGE